MITTFDLHQNLVEFPRQGVDTDKQLHASGQDTGEVTSEKNVFAVWPFSTQTDVSISSFQTPPHHPVPLRHSGDFPGGPVVKTLCF